MQSKVLTEIIQKKYFSRKVKSFFGTCLIYFCALAALSCLFYVFGFVVKNGFPYLNLSFFTELPKPVGESGGGMANALLGTLILVALASLIGIPWGVLTGVYLSEYGRGKFANLIRFSIDLMTSVPSIIMGLFVYTLLVLPMKRFSAIAGATALSFLMVPIVAKTTEEILKLMPTHIREAGLGLGLPRWKVILRIVLKGSVSGITTGVMLAVARVAGETAPLLFTALGSNFWHRGLDEPIASLPVQIYNYAISPFKEWHAKAWAGALVLVMIVFLLNLIARIFLRPKLDHRD